MRKKFFSSRIAALPIAVVALAFATNASAVVTISANVTTDDTWGDIPAEADVILDGAIFVTNGATLTIVEGTIVRGQPRTAAVQQGVTAGTPGALIVTQDGTIIANGGPNNPIIMTTAAVDNDGDGVPDDLDSDGFLDAYPGIDPATCPGACSPDATPTFYDDDPLNAPLAPLDANGDENVSLWGGLVVLGSAPTNNADQAGVGFGKQLIEGLTVPGHPAAFATFGGFLPHDSSGEMSYLSVRHAGDELGNGNELNGISLGGVGDGTRFDHIEVYCNFDDGIEWFGGTVFGEYLHVAYAGDDTFDLDQGYTGINQHLFGVMPFFNENSGNVFGASSGDKGGEFDGDDYRPDNASLNDNVAIRVDWTLTDIDSVPSPLSNPAMYNITLIGSTPDGGQDFTPTSSASANLGIQMRNGFNGEVLNSIVVNTGGQKGLAIDTGFGDGTPGFDTLDNVNNGFTALVSSTPAAKRPRPARSSGRAPRAGSPSGLPTASTTKPTR